jgi:hypothetical protein
MKMIDRKLSKTASLPVTRLRTYGISLFERMAKSADPINKHQGNSRDDSCNIRPTVSSQTLNASSDHPASIP